jgi:hypothetical protein
MAMMHDTLRSITVSLFLGLAAAGCSNSSLPTAPGDASPPQTTPNPTPNPTPTPPPAPQTARYMVVFASTWSSSTHPTDFPDDAHYSGLIGGTHASAVTFWREGSLASEGIKRMAERGSKSPLDAEVQAAIAAGTAQHVLSGPSLGTSPAANNMEFDISQAFPLVTLVTMIAPSPDWFVGVAGLPLFQNGQWVDEVKVDLYGFDAGTDSGATYAAPDAETSPRQPIRRLAGYPVEANGTVLPFGTFTLRRLP